MFKTFFLSLILTIAIPLSTFATTNNAVIEKYIPDAKKIGEGRLSVFLTDVYDAELFASNKNSIAQNKPPYALTLSYLRPLKSETIAKRSAKEMRNIGLNDELKIAAWHEKMRKIFPDVKDGTSITGIYTADKQTVFYQSGNEIGRITDPEFGKYFFGIWLNEKTSAPNLRSKLLGKKDS